MTIDLEELDLDELKDLRKRVDKTIDEYEERKRREALARLEEVAKEMGFSMAELVDPSTGKKRRTTPVKPKYRHKDNHDLTWSGRGRRPKWFDDAELIPGSE